MTLRSIPVEAPAPCRDACRRLWTLRSIPVEAPGSCRDACRRLWPEPSAVLEAIVHLGINFCKKKKERKKWGNVMCRAPLSGTEETHRQWANNFVVPCGVLLVVQSSLTLCDPMDCSPPVLCPWDSPGKNTGVGCHFLLQGIFLTQGSNPYLLHCGQILYCLSHR